MKKVHVIGAGGIGLSAAAKYLLHQGVQVTGSDMVRTNVTDLLAARGATVTIGQKAENVPADADLVLYSAAVPATNPERMHAKELGIRELTYNEYLGELSRTRRTIAISGTHGKSTTTAMLGKILEDAGLDPLVIVGSLVPSFPEGNLRLGNGEWFVVEACEHMRHFLELTPEIAVVTNIEPDHLDYYRDLADIKEAFGAFASRAKQVVWFGEDAASRELFSDRSEGIALDSSLKPAVPGRHNAIDASLAVHAAELVGVPRKQAAQTIAGYTGIWRRFERVGEFNGAPVYSDYAHHPTEIRATLQAAREVYPNHRLIVAFKPHQRDRTKHLWNEFVRCFELADMLILADIYEPSGRELADESVTSVRLLDEIRAHNEVIGKKQACVHKATNDDVLEFLDQTVRPPVKGMAGDVVFVIGAGNIDDVARSLVV